MSGEQALPPRGVFTGIISGDARARKGSDIEVKGIVGGRLIVEAGAAVRVTGIVDGEIDERGGDVTVSGIVG